MRMRFEPDQIWISRNKTRRGHIDPPRFASNDTWRPSTVDGRLRRAEFERRNREDNPQLQPGMLVICDRAPYRVVEIRETPDDLWPEEFEDRWQQSMDWWLAANTDEPPPARATYRQRPVTVVLEPDGGGKERHVRCPADYQWPVLSEHYSVCRKCGHLPPCPEELADRAVDREVNKAEHLMGIREGACMGCGETIGPRQKKVRFPGPNLWRPDMTDGSAVFHGRQECEEFVDRYQAQWVAAGAPAGGVEQALPLDGEA